MKKDCMRFLCLLLAVVMVICMMPVSALAAEPRIQTDLTVTARYMTNRLSWSAENGVTYTVERSEDNESWTAIGTSATGTYLDADAGLGTRYFYRLTDGDAHTAGVQGSVTGMGALKEIAVLFYEGNDSIPFDGSNKVVLAEGAKAAELNDLESGTIVYKAYFNDVSGVQAVLGTDSGCYVGANGTKFRHELGGGFMGNPTDANMTAGADNTAGFVYDDSNGHWALSSNGAGPTAVDLDETRFGMLTAANAGVYYAGGSSAQSFRGTVNYILILSEVLTDAELRTLTGANLDHDEEAVLPLGANIGMMVEYVGDENNSNTWMFDGGSTTAGSFTRIGSVRNYVYQFEEYVRGKKMAAISTGWNSRQRYTVNVGKAGQNLAESLAAFDRRAEELDPRAAVYLVGAEDYGAGADGVEAFKTDLLAYIRKAVNLRNGSGFAMIQTPYPDDSSENDELYAAAVREVMDGLTGSIRGNVVLVDHNSAAFGADCFHADGSLSGRGHDEMGRQLSAAVYGSSDGYQNLPTLTPAAAPASYSDAVPAITSENDALTVSGLEDRDWTVELALDSYTLTVNAKGPDITVENLPAGEDYILTLTAADLSVRMPIMAGTVGGGAGSVYEPERNANQQAIADLADGDEPLTWLFMGDSITHGASYTFGHDSISQLFEKFLKDDLGRTDDTVINTAVSSADTNDTIAELHARLNRYQPDVVSIMIGTNDSAAHINVGETKYKENLRTIIAAIKAKGAKVILRTPVPTKDGSRANIGDYADWMGEVAGEYDDVILVEQYDSMGALFAAAPHMRSVLFNSGDYLHPTTEGQTWMLHRFLEAAGLMRDGYLANLSYDYSTETVSEIVPPVTFADGTAAMDTAELASAYGQSLYLVRLMAADSKGNVYSAEGRAGQTLTMKNLPEDVTFTAEAKLADSNVWVTFGVPKTVDVEVIVGRTQTVVVDGEVTPNTEDVAGIAEVTAKTKVMAMSALDNTFSAGYTALADCEYTFDRQSDGTYLIHADVDGTTVYVDPHAGAGNAGYPNRTHQSRITLEPGTNGAFRFHQMNEGYLHFWDNDDSKLYWDQCSADGGHSGHNIFIYRPADGNETASSEVPGYVKITNADQIVSGGKYLIVAKANSGGYYAMKPCKTASNKYQHICKIAGTVTELTVTGLAEGSGTVYAGNHVIHIRVVASASTRITLNYNYDGAPENEILTAVTGDPIGELPVPMRPGYTFFGWYLNGSKITSSYVVTESVTLTADWVTVSTKEKPTDGTTANGQPFPERFDNGSAYCYRIPGIVTLSDGTVVAMADARWNTWADCGGLDTIISASKDNGKTWTYTYANYLGDNGDIYNPWSTTFIDPAIATDGETVYMIADLFPAGVSTMANGYASQAGSGGFNADGKLMLRDLAGDTYKHGNGNEKSAYISMATSRSYDFYLDPNADGTYTVRRESDDSAVDGYTVDAMLNIRSADGTVDTHLFMADSPYQVYPTNYLYLTKSTDGLNWSAPELIVAKTASESAYLIGPGSGTYDAVHGNMVFTAYSYSGSASSQKTSLLWAGKDGRWHRSEDATTDVWSSEASAVVLEDGTVRVFYRSGSSILCYTDYLWDGDEYVRDEANTSVSTAAVKNGGNGCMLSAVKYPGKINGREMIFVATPATLGSRSDGHIYGFYVNKNGTMELVADCDITPGSAEYYAYSCLTVLTDGEESGDLALFWEDSWASSPAAATIRYSVIAIEDVLAGVKEVVRQEVNLTVGETASFEDKDGYYVGADTSELDTAVATVEITGTVTETAMAAGEAVTAIADGTYIIVNTRAGKPMTNGTASADGGNGLSLSGTKDNVPEAGIWTVRAVSGGYTVQDADGRYLTVGSNTAGLSNGETILQIIRNGNTWTISQNGAYLNDFGGKGTCAAGWQHSSAPNDAGSQWLIYTVEEVPVAGTSEITFTGVGVGQTSVLIGNTIYSITVTEAARVNPFVDVPEDSFYIDPVLWAVEKGITTGVSETRFDPNGECMRAVVVTFLWRAAGEPEPASTHNPFVDVKESDFYYKAVLWAVENEITNGMDTTHFGPTVKCNRAQVVTFLWRAMGKPDSGAAISFTDVKAGQFYTDAVAWAVENEITNGISATEFGVDKICNRAQVVTFLYRTYHR
ncbi:MAG: S-layer homology domain-containing protein [Oscillospiraceae bacterium]|nr:S-layer homology domain-containing protein [Oscillospiraceae bacterium]